MAVFLCACVEGAASAAAGVARERWIPGGTMAELEPALRARSDLLYFEGFESAGWHLRWDRTRRGDARVNENLSLVPEGLIGSALRVGLQAGLIGSTGSGDSGTGFTLAKAGATPSLHSEVHLRYHVKLDPEFPFVFGGKLPGLLAHQPYGGGRHPEPGKGWSARYMWDECGELYLYAYHQGGKGWGTQLHAALGGRRAALIPGRWHCIEQAVRLNTLRKRADGSYEAVADGAIRTWLDGNLVQDIQDIIWITAPGERDEPRQFGSQFQCFFGGGSAEWAPPRNTWIAFDGLVMAGEYIGPCRDQSLPPKPGLRIRNAEGTTERWVEISAPPGTTIRYCLNGRAPSHTSEVYRGPIRLVRSATVTARVFSEEGRYGEPSALHVSIPEASADALVVHQPATADAFVRCSGTFTGSENASTVRHGLLPDLLVRAGVAGSERRALVKFSVEPFRSAHRVRLAVPVATRSPRPTTLALWRASTDWPEESVAWENRPAEGDLCAEPVVLRDQDWIEWDVSNEVSAAVASDNEEIAFTIVALDDGGGIVALGSRELGKPAELRAW